jgi:uncharacterized membrane protein YhdT
MLAVMSDQPTTGAPKQSNASLWLLLIPVAALIFPGFYNRETPTLFGFPFFYWYQLAWVFLATAILALVYKLRKHNVD